MANRMEIVTFSRSKFLKTQKDIEMLLLRTIAFSGLINFLLLGPQEVKIGVRDNTNFCQKLKHVQFCAALQTKIVLFQVWKGH